MSLTKEELAAKAEQNMQMSLINEAIMFPSDVQHFGATERTRSFFGALSPHLQSLQKSGRPYNTDYQTGVAYFLKVGADAMHIVLYRYDITAKITTRGKFSIGMTTERNGRGKPVIVHYLNGVPIRLSDITEP